MSFTWPSETSRRLFAMVAPALADLPADMPWNLGGGTALAMWLGHRTSNDIDLFFEAAQALRLLSPQRNPKTRAISDRWQQAGHYLKFEVSGVGEIDILVTQSWMEPPDVSAVVGGIAMRVQRPAEILAREIVHRGVSFKMCDFFDLAAAAHADAKLVDELHSVISPRLDELEGRWFGLSAALQQQLSRAVAPTASGAAVAQDIRRIVAEVFAACGGKRLGDGTSA